MLSCAQTIGRFVLTVTNFLYLASSQSAARTQIRACFLSSALRTSLSPLTSPKWKKQRVQNTISPRADQGACLYQRSKRRDRYIPSLACDFLITLLMASLMLSALTSSSTSGTSTSCWLWFERAWVSKTGFGQHIHSEERDTYLSSWSDMMFAFVWFKCEICKWIK